jgi:DNA-binding MarR family transcriptional regulator
MENRRSLSRKATMTTTRKKAAASSKAEAGPATVGKADAIAELILEVAQCFFRVRALGQKTGLITSWGGGAFGFMRSIALLGPLTVPQIAQMRPTSRQRMQRLANELAAEGLVEFTDNPRHRRSKLVKFTPKGELNYRKLNDRFLLTSGTLGIPLSEADIRHATKIVRQLSNDIKSDAGA